MVSYQLYHYFQYLGTTDALDVLSHWYFVYYVTQCLGITFGVTAFGFWMHNCLQYWSIGKFYVQVLESRKA